jgi:hypothetical protein
LKLPNQYGSFSSTAMIHSHVYHSSKHKEKIDSDKMVVPDEGSNNSEAGNGGSSNGGG